MLNYLLKPAKKQSQITALPLAAAALVVSGCGRSCVSAKASSTCAVLVPLHVVPALAASWS